MILLKEMTEMLSRGEDFVVSVILTRSGSAPREAGTRMVSRRDGSFFGTIGGGILEARVLTLAQEVFQHRRTVVRQFVLTAEDACRMGMICGGELQVLIHFVQGNDPLCRDLFQAMSHALEAGKQAWLITRIPSQAETEGPPAQCFYGADGTTLGRMGSVSLDKITCGAAAGRVEVVTTLEGTFLVEPMAHEATVLIFGAGHISQKLALLTRMVGFRTIVLDDREEFANAERFPSADGIVVLSSFGSVADGLDVDEDSYVVLVTRGHAHDKDLLGQALRTRAGYVGMIGSRRKRDAVYEALRGEGFADADFQRVHSPIGLDIGAETPEEIAVSIAAELIQARAGKQR